MSNVADTLYKTVSIEKLLTLFPLNHPFQAHIWFDFILEKESVLQKASCGDLMTTFFMEGHKTFPVEYFSKDPHERRVAYLFLCGWSDPLEIDVGAPSLGCHVVRPVQDGNHRLAAAILRKQKTIKASCSGDLELIEQLI